MNSEAKACASLGLLRDQITVFYGGRGILDNAGLSAGEALAKVRELYDAFDESHPPVGQEQQ